MANQVEKLNGIEIASIEKLNGLTDDNIEKLNGLEFAGVTDAMVLIESITATDASPTAAFTFNSGIDSTYDVHMFEFINIHATDGNGADDVFTFQVNATDTADYNDVNISSNFIAYYHDEDDSSAAAGGDGNYDIVNSTSYANLMRYMGDENDESTSGKLWIFGLADGSNVKNFTGEFGSTAHYNANYNTDISGFIGLGDTTAIDDIQFKMAVDTVSGTVKQWGLALS